jgi:MEMO1 family protein
VASSDLSHFHSYDTAKEMDQRLLESVKAMDADRLYDSLENRTCEACGRGPIITAMLLSRKLGANSCRVLEYANSGDVTGDKTSPRGVVGYASAVFYETRRDKDRSEKTKSGVDLGLSDADKAELHAIARSVIEAACRGKDAPSRGSSEVSPKLKELRGAFVTIYKKGELRGCIGQVTARQPLADAVAESAESAALRDPRFTPLRPEELPDITVEISALTPFKKIESPAEIEVGKHGLIIIRGRSAGLLLPQVATEYHWDRTAFLEHTCIKAGLPKDAWKDKETEIYTFSADVF